MNRGDPALFYLLAIRSIQPEYWMRLDDWFRGFAISAGTAAGTTAREGVLGSGSTDRAERDTIEAPSTSTCDPKEPSVGIALPDPFFSSAIPIDESYRVPLSNLDELIERMILDTVTHVEGAFVKDQVNAVVDELIRINGRRSQSRYHSGLRDALFGLAAGPVPAIEGPEASRWYFAGHLKGLVAIRHDSQACLRLYDEQEVVRGLGDTGVGASSVGGVYVLDALLSAGRFEEASQFVTVMAASHSLELCTRLLDAGTGLLRQEQPSQARAFFETLWRALAERIGDEREVPSAMWSDVRRRYAHCLSYEDNPAAARIFLEELLADPTDENRAAVLTDLALLDAGYRRLHELHLPATTERLADMAQELACGGARLEEAIGLGTPTSGHAHYVKGMIYLLSRRDAEAVPHLDTALSLFERRPHVYRGGHLLQRARLHLGLALCLGLDQSHAERGHRLLQNALRAGERIPLYLTTDLIEALAMTDPALAAQLADGLVAGPGGEVVDELARSPVAMRSEAVADALLRRARARDRSLTARAQDWHTALPLLLTQMRIDEAEEALDALEGMALDGVLQDEYLQLLTAERNYGPAWRVEDAVWSTVRCLESQARYDEAAGFLRQLFQRAFVTGGADGRELALEALQRLDDYGEEAADVREVVRRRFEAHFEESEEAGAGLEIGTPVRILVVGGNEDQARFDERLRLELTHEHPHICVEFFHTGWTSNWGRQLEEFERRLPAFDGVVFSRYMRTMFGRSARKVCHLPWRGCGGRGRAAFQRAILAAAGAARFGHQPSALN
jgi:hypothetical protein